HGDCGPVHGPVDVSVDGTSTAGGRLGGREKSTLSLAESTPWTGGRKKCPRSGSAGIPGRVLPGDYGASNRCAWCGGHPDSRSWRLGGHDVWLHSQCVSPWGLASREGGQPEGLSHETERRLRLCGYSHDRIASMTPQEAHGILGQLAS